MERHTVNTSFGTLSYLQAGAGEPLVLIHGFCGSAHYWDAVIPQLATHGTVYAFDLAGHGQSSEPQIDYTIEQFADQLAEATAALGLAKFRLFGHSLGGYIALAFAEKYEAHLTSVSLIHSTAFPDSDEGKQNRDNGRAKLASDGIAPFVAGLVPKLFGPNAQQVDIDTALAIGEATSVAGARSALAAMRDRRDRNDILAKVNVPVLLLAGEQDALIPVERVHSVAGEHITAVTLAGVGHMGMYEAPEALVNAIVAFIS